MISTFETFGFVKSSTLLNFAKIRSGYRAIISQPYVSHKTELNNSFHFGADDGNDNWV